MSRTELQHFLVTLWQESGRGRWPKTVQPSRSSVLHRLAHGKKRAADVGGSK